MGTPDPNDPTNPQKVTPTNQLLVHSTFTGWSQVSLPSPASDLAITVPSVGAYLAGQTTTARSYCTSTTLTSDGSQVASNENYPLADTENVVTDRIAATDDGLHILGATVANGGTLSDLTFTQTLPPPPPSNDPYIPAQPPPPAAGAQPQPWPPKGSCPALVAPDYFHQFIASPNTHPLGVTADTITGVIPTTSSSLAFITYTGTSGVLPAYAPASGTITPIPLTGATAPVAGTISSDDLTVYVGTSGDNKVHLIDSRSLTDNPSGTITPNLPQFLNGNDVPSTIVTPNLLVQHPRKATS